MTPSTNLFDIIHSLTASEKRYFKVFSGTHVIGTKNNYEKLFNAYSELPANEPYDEESFKKKLSGKKWAKNFAREKKFLEEMLMKAMRAYNAEKTAEGALNDVIANVHFLYNKGLIAAANKELQKGIKLAEDLENLPNLITLYQLKLNLTRITQTPADVKVADEDLEAETRILAMMDIERRIVHARRKIYNYYISGQLKKKIAEANILQDELNKLEPGQLLTYKARMSLFFIRAMIAEKEGRFEDAMLQYEQANSLWKKNELKLHESYSNLRTILSNYLACAHYASRFDVYPSIIAQMESFPIDSISDQADTFIVAEGAKLIYMLNIPEKKGAIELVKEVEHGLKKFKDQIPRQDLVFLNINICLLLFQTRDYDYLLMTLTNAYTIIGRDEKMAHILACLKFVEALAQCSLRNYSVLSYQVRNTDRWLRDHKLNEPFTDYLLKALIALQTSGHYEKIRQELSTIECSINLQTLKVLALDWLESNQKVKTNDGQKAARANANQPGQRSRR